GVLDRWLLVAALEQDGLDLGDADLLAGLAVAEHVADHHRARSGIRAAAGEGGGGDERGRAERERAGETTGGRRASGSHGGHSLRKLLVCAAGREFTEILVDGQRDPIGPGGWGRIPLPPARFPGLKIVSMRSRLSSLALLATLTVP